MVVDSTLPIWKANHMASIRAMIAAPTILIAVFTFGPVSALMAQEEASTEQLHGELQEIEHALAELNRSDSATPDQREQAKELQHRAGTIQEILSDREHEPSRGNLRGQFEELNHEIERLREQDLSPEGTPDRWDVLQRLLNQRREVGAALERQGGDKRRTDERAENRGGRLRERMRSMLANAAEYRQARRNLDVERDEGPRRERRVERREEQPLRLKIFAIEHADGETLVKLILGFLPDGTRAAFDVRTSKLIVLTPGAAIERAHYMVQELDIATP